MKVMKVAREEKTIFSHSFHIRLFFLLVSSFVRIKRVQISAVSGSVHEMASDNGKLTEKFHVVWDRNSTNQNHYVLIIFLHLFLWTILTTPNESEGVGSCLPSFTHITSHITHATHTRIARRPFFYGEGQTAFEEVIVYRVGTTVEP